MRDLAALLRAKAEALRAEARAICHEPRMTRREVYLLCVALQRAASGLDDDATAMEDEADDAM